ncbi:MAG: 50S ribosomal protein L9 [Candidatus Cloacimonetes bacterium]|nr:50S ribosomal protein L9 [Candidatus Cloacimonadota bacterium]
MKIILVEDLKTLGEAGAVVNVKDGYARNYLLPRKYAIAATKSNLTQIGRIKKASEQAKLELENQYKVLVDKINVTELLFVRKADENDHLFGSVSEVDIVNALTEKDIEVHKSTVKMEGHLKTIGDFVVNIVFTSESAAELKVKIDKE